MNLSRLLVVVTSTVTVSLAGVAIPASATPATAYTWVGASQDDNADNHSWGDQRNWNPQGVPGNGDSVAIEPPDGSHCVAHVDGVPSGLTLANFSLTVGSFCAASISGGSITVSGSFDWDTGVIDTPMTLASGGVGSISGFETDNPRKQLTQNFTVGGTLTMTDAFLEIFDPQVLTISPGGTLRAFGATQLTSIACCVNPARVVNNGSLEVGSGELNIDGVQLDQNKHVDVAAGAFLRTTAAPVTAAGGATYTGAGHFLLSNGSDARISGTQKIGPGAHFDLGNDGTGGSSMGGTASFTGTGEFGWTGGTLKANLTIGHTVTMHLYGANTGNGRRILSGLDDSGDDPVPASVVVHGSVVIEQLAEFATAQAARLNVAADGMLSLAPGTQLTTFSCCVDPSMIINDGGLVSVPTDTGGAGPAALDGVAYQATAGTTKIARGSELQLIGGPPSTLTDTSVTGGGRLTDADPTALAGTVTVAGSSSIRLIGSHGSLDGTATVAGTGTLDWRGGSMSGDLAFTNGGGISLSGPDRKSVTNVGGGSNPSTVHVTGPVSFANGKKNVHNTLDVGASTMTLAGATSVGNFAEINGGTLLNTGTMTFDPGSKGSDFTDANLSLVNKGKMLLKSGKLVSSGSFTQTIGTTALGAGTTFAAPFSSHPLAVAGGKLTGTGTVDGSVLNSSGTVDPGSLTGKGPTGTLTVTGDYTQGAGGRLAVDVATTKRDLLAVSGTAEIAGTLVANTMNGYHPQVGDKKKVVTTGGGLTWSVGCVITSGQDSDSGHWQPKASASALILAWRSGSSSGCLLPI